MLTDYIPVFDGLNKLNSFQFASYISGSQYIKAYELVKKYAPKSAEVLDWGTGSGHFSYFLLQNGYKVTGYTVEDQCQLSGYMSENYPGKYSLVVNPESTRLPFESDRFDIVVSIGVLEHVRETGGNEVNSLTEIKRVLKPNGVFLCYHFPNKYSWIEALTKHIKNKHHHIYKYSRHDIKKMLSDTGLELLECGRYGMLPRLTFREIPNNIGTTEIFNKADNLISAVLNPFSQNYYFAGRKIS